MKKTCTVESLRRDALDDAISIFLGNAKSFKKVNETSVFMPVSQKFSKNQLYAIAMSKSQNLSNIMKAKYGEKFSRGWININDRVYGDGIMINFKVPSELDLVFTAKIKNITIEDARKVKIGGYELEKILKLFESIPELTSIGTPEQYSQYLDSVFPNSKLKVIAYNTTNIGREIRDKTYFHTDRSYSREIGSTYADDNVELRTIAAIINVTNPTVLPEVNFEIVDKIKNYETIIGEDVGQKIMGAKDGSFTIVTNNRAQIYQLGTKEDLDKFKKFVVKTTNKTLTESEITVNQTDLENLNYTPKVINYLYENSTKKFSRERFEAIIVEITDTLRYAKSNQEILDTIKCL